MVPQTPGKRMGLRARIIEAAGWTLGAHAAELGIRLVSNLIMTRLLFPEAFGLMAVVITIPVGLALITDAGITGSIIRSTNGEDHEFLRSAWTLQAIRGIVIWLIVLAVAGGLSMGSVHRWLPEQSTLADPLVPALLVIVGMIVALQGLESVNLHVCARRMDFRRLTMIRIGSKLIALPVMLVWVYYDRTVWALVAGMIASSLCGLVLSHALIPGPRMGLRWHRKHVSELFHFGKWITVSSAATFVSSHSHSLILGALFPGSILGVYAIARLLMDAFQGVLQQLPNSLTLPVLAEVLRTDPNALREKYYRFRLPIEVPAFLAAGALLTAGPGIVDILYDERYRDAGWMLQILALTIIAVPFHIIENGFLATGETRIVAGVSMFHGFTLVALLFLGYFAVGLQGALFGIALARFPAVLVFLMLANRRGWISPWREVGLLPVVGIGAMIGQGCMWIANSLDWTSWSSW